MRTCSQWTSPNPNAAGQNTAVPPVGRRYSDYLLRKSGGAAIVPADVPSITCNANGRPLWTLSGTQLNNINRVFGLTAFNDDVLRIPHRILGMEDTSMAVLTEINTGVQGKSGKIISNVDIQYTSNVNSQFQVETRDEASTPEGPGLVKRFTPYTILGGGAGAETQANIELPYGTAQDAYWGRLYMTPSAGTIDKVRIEANGNVWELSRASMLRMLADGGRNNGIFGYVVDFAIDGMGRAPLILPSTGEVLAGSNPFLPTLGWKNQQGVALVKPKIFITNSNAAATNEIILEHYGEL